GFATHDLIQRDLEDLGETGAGVLGVHRDFAFDERLVGDLGAAEVHAVLGGDPGVLEHLEVHLAEDELLGEVLGADDDRLAILRHHAGGHRGDAGGDEWYGGSG